MNVKLLSAPGVLIEKQQIHIMFDAIVFRNKAYRWIEITAPFLLVPLKIGERSFNHITVLNTVIDEIDDPLAQEFLERIALGKPVHWLKQLREGADLSSLVQRLREFQKELEPYRKIAWALKKNGFVMHDDNLLVLGSKNTVGIEMKYLYVITPSTIKRNTCPQLHPQTIAWALETASPCSGAMLRQDRTLRRNLIRAFESEIMDEQALEDIIARVFGAILKEDKRSDK